MTELSLAASGYDAEMTPDKAMVLRGLTVAATVYFLFSAVCLWRSANNDRASPWWALFVKLSVLGGAVTVLWGFVGLVGL